MSTPSIQPDEETMRRNLAITLQQQQPPQANPLEPQMAAPGPIDLPGQPKAPDMSIFPASKPPVVFGPFGQGGKGMAQRGTPEGDKQEIQRLSSTGSGVSQIPGRIESAMPNHPVLGKVLGQGAGVLARIGDTILSNLPGSLNGVGKGIESMIPGTQGYHQAQPGQATGQLNNETANAEKEAQTGNLGAEAGLHTAQAKNMPLQLQESAGEQGMKVDANGQLVPQAPGEQSPGFKTKQELEQAQIYGLKNPWAKLPDKEPLTNVDDINAGMADRFHVSNKGAVPPQYVLPPNATKGDFERIDKLLTANENAASTQSQRETVNQMRAQTYALAMQNSINAQEGRQANIDAKKMKWVMGQNSSGETIAVPLSQAETMGLQNLAELPSNELKDMFNARHAVKLATQIGDPKNPETMGTLQLMDSLERDGKLGVAASRMNKFMTRGLGSEPGDDPRIAALLNKGDLFTTGIMLAHFGAAGGRSPKMLEHFVQMADSGKMEGPTLKAGTKALVNYMQERAMMPSQQQSQQQPGNAAPQGQSQQGNYPQGGN